MPLGLLIAILMWIGIAIIIWSLIKVSSDN